MAVGRASLAEVGEPMARLAGGPPRPKSATRRRAGLGGGGGGGGLGGVGGWLEGGGAGDDLGEPVDEAGGFPDETIRGGTGLVPAADEAGEIAAGDVVEHQAGRVCVEGGV